MSANAMKCEDGGRYPEPKTLEEIHVASKSAFSYCGTFDVNTDDKTVTHHIKAGTYPNFNWVNTDLVRTFTFEGDDRLVLCTTENLPGLPPDLVGKVTCKLTWLRA